MKKTLVVIDDDQEIRPLLSKVLRLAGGYEVYAAANGEAGLELVRQHQPNLVLSDLDMPLMNGSEVLKAIRNDKATHSIPVILMTGHSEKLPFHEAMLLGADDYLPKPFSNSDLLETVRCRLERHQQVRNLADAKLAQMRSFLGTSLPHELLTPLTGIIGYSELLAFDHDKLRPSEVLEMANEITQSGLRLLRAVRNLILYLELDRAAANRDAHHALQQAATVRIDEAVRDAAMTLAKRLNRESDLRLTLCGCSAQIQEDHFRKVVEEITDNALKFSPAGSPVEIATLADAGQLIVTFRDSGRGFSAEQIAQIDTFQQFDRPQQEQQGMGLGLAIVRRIVEIYGGEWKFRSQPGNGTTVEIRLNSTGVPPAASAVPATHSKPQEGTSPSTASE